MRKQLLETTVLERQFESAIATMESLEEPENISNGCCHYWVIEVATLPLSKGSCSMCGEERFFRNQLKWAEIAPVRANFKKSKRRLHQEEP